MSKQSEAKARQGWVAKPVNNCANCAHFQFTTLRLKTVFGRDYEYHKNFLCALGGFKTNRIAMCYKWAAKPEQSAT